MNSKFACLVSVILLSGCGVHKSNFNCSPHNGVGCSSITKVNAMVEQGTLEKTTNRKSNIFSSWFKKKSKPVFSANNTLSANVYRSPEQTIKIWVAPYQDDQNTYWEDQYVHKVVTTSKWKIKGNS